MDKITAITNFSSGFSRDCKLLNLNLAIISSLQNIPRTVGYEIKYNATCSNDTAPAELTFPLRRWYSRGLYAQTIMEEAVTRYGSSYRFSATYFGRTLGYFIDQLNGTSSSLANSCFWAFLIRHRNGTEVLSSKGVTNTFIYRGQSMIMSYQQFSHN